MGEGDGTVDRDTAAGVGVPEVLAVAAPELLPQHRDAWVPADLSGFGLEPLMNAGGPNTRPQSRPGCRFGRGCLATVPGVLDVDHGVYIVHSDSWERV